MTKELFLGSRFCRLKTCEDLRGLQERGLIDSDLRRVNQVTK